MPYFHMPVMPETKRDVEQRQLDLLAGKVDLVVLARYMQILSGDFLTRLGAPVINVHHSFLPAQTRTRVHARGVKLIGATAHYATEELNERIDHGAGRPPGVSSSRSREASRRRPSARDS